VLSTSSSSSSSSHFIKSKGGIALANFLAKYLKKCKDEGRFTDGDRIALLTLIRQNSYIKFLKKLTPYLQDLEQRGTILSADYDYFKKNIELLNYGDRCRDNCYKFRKHLNEKIEEWTLETTSSSSSLIEPISINSIYIDFWDVLYPYISADPEHLNSVLVELKQNPSFGENMKILMEKLMNFGSLLPEQQVKFAHYFNSLF